jgi:hypothetical protein
MCYALLSDPFRISVNQQALYIVAQSDKSIFFFFFFVCVCEAIGTAATPGL